ncbi:MAG: hypothetical protein KHX55_07260, partial [Proteobacteria bacterium]|nr:hypothetical protein [Pseudomonadota bacterium]
IESGSGNDTIIGGKGNDVLYGSYGNDTYIWNLGDGMDTIFDNEGENVIQLGDGISLSDLTFSRDVNNLVIVVKGEENQGITIADYFVSSSRQKQTLKFIDGTSFNLDGAELTLVEFPQLTLNGDDDDNELIGGIGNDTINSGDGYNDITGGKGNDTLNGGYDNDTYYYNLGDGADVISDPRGRDQIVFGAGITADDVIYRREGSNLKLIIKGDEGQSISIDKFFSDSNYRIESVKFADGTVKNIATAGLTLTQSGASDNFSATSYNDVIYGHGGNDTINAGDGNDTLIGGTGNDTLNGGNGDDVYKWNLGDGFDTISDEQGQDKIVFGAGITAADLRFIRQSNDLRIIINNDENQGMRIVNQFYGSNRIEKIEFADGTEMMLTDTGMIFSQTNANDSVKGTDYDDVIYGNGGNDTINAGDGNDILIGGTGNDELTGGNGDDVYKWNLGDGFDTISDAQGQDKIVFGAGITAADLRFIRQSNDLRIIINNDENQGILISDQFYGSNRIEKIEFADGTSMMLTDAGMTFVQTEGAETINGTDYDDVIYGKGGNDMINAGDGNDTLIGGTGNDTLNGGYGRDTYIYNLGDGADVISEERGNDKIVFGAGIAFEDLTFSRNGTTLTITVKGDDAQSITIKDYYYNANNQVEKLEFADGSVFNLSTSGLTLHQKNGDETISGTSYDDVIYGYGGNDTINSGDGNDTLIGGTGNDTLNGGAGDDTYVWNLGDGIDTIIESGGNDKIVFGQGINQNNLSFVRIGSDLKIMIDGDEVKGIQISEQFGNNDKKVETLEFADGSTMDISAADQLVQAMSSFSLSNSASTDELSNPVQSVSEMYDNFACGSNFGSKAA